MLGLRNLIFFNPSLGVCLHVYSIYLFWWGKNYVKPQSDLFAETQWRLLCLLSPRDASSLPAPADAPCPSLPAGPAATEDQGEARGSGSCSGSTLPCWPGSLRADGAGLGVRGGRGPRLGLLSISAVRPGLPGASFLGGQGTGGLWPQSEVQAPGRGLPLPLVPLLI